MGRPQEQAQHELRQTQPGSALLLRQGVYYCHQASETSQQSAAHLHVGLNFLDVLKKIWMGFVKMSKYHHEGSLCNL